MKNLYFAWYESRNFTFEAFGVTAAEAKKALIDGLKTHAVQYNTDEKHWWYDDDICVVKRIVGDCYRDGSLILNFDKEEV